MLLEYGEDVDGAVYTLCEGALHSEAIRIVRSFPSLAGITADLLCPSQATLQSHPQLIDERVKPSTLELQQRLLDDCSDLEEQVEKQVSRLSELKRKRDENPCTPGCSLVKLPSLLTLIYVRRLLLLHR